MFDGLAVARASTVDLLERARQGDAYATDALFQRSCRRCALARGRLPANARELCDTEDLVQDTLTGALRHMAAFERGIGLAAGVSAAALLNRVRDEVAAHAPAGSGRRIAAEWPDAALRLWSRCSVGPRSIGRSALVALAYRSSRSDPVADEFGCTYEELAIALGKPSANAARVASVVR